MTFCVSHIIDAASDTVGLTLYWLFVLFPASATGDGYRMNNANSNVELHGYLLHRVYAWLFLWVWNEKHVVCAVYVMCVALFVVHAGEEFALSMLVIVPAAPEKEGRHALVEYKDDIFVYGIEIVRELIVTQYILCSLSEHLFVCKISLHN